MKRKMFFRLTAVCLMAVSVLIACTKDYGSDIKKLQDDMSKLTAQVDKLQKCIDDGCVITDVTPIENGVKVTLSNGKDPFYIYNGKDGKDGKDGEDGDDGKDGKDGTVWKIGDNGNWWSSTEGQPFVDTGKPSRGPQGDPGKSAYEVAKANGFSGTEKEWLDSLKGEKGDKGDTGDYYYPCCSKESDNYGKWIKVDGATGEETPTTDEWLPEGTITAVWDPVSQELTLHNVEGADDGIVVINLFTILKSFALIPELWDADLGMATAQVYAITPSAAETARLLFANVDVPFLPRWKEYFSQQGGAGLNGTWAAFNFKADLAYMNIFFWCAIWNTWLGVTGLKDSWYFEDMYDCTFDMYVSEELNEEDNTRFRYWWQDIHNNAEDGYTTELTYADLANAVKRVVAQMGTRLEKVSGYPESITRQPPVSALNLKYRINPAGADIDGYQFSMIDRSLQVLGGEDYYMGREIQFIDVPGYQEIYKSKAEGDHRAAAVAKVETERVGKDQLNVTGYIDYFKYWADKPTEWFIMVMTTTAAMAWDYWQDNLDFNSIPTAEYWDEAEIMGSHIDATVPHENDGSSRFIPSYNAMRRWLAEQGMSFETIVALEAAKSANGAEAVVSDYNSVKVDFVTPIWTAYNRRYRYQEAYTARWRIAPNIAQIAAAALPDQNLFKDPRTFENDYLVEGQPYDVAAHMRFADPYYGRLEDLGFEVKYDYYVYEAKNTPAAHTGANSGSWADVDDNPCGETEENFGGWDKVTCTPAGIVKTKDDATDAIGKYVVITADASIKNKATDTWYTSEIRGNFSSLNHGGDASYLDGVAVDEFAGHYVLLIVPDPSKAANVTYDLGTLDYLKLSKTFSLPAPIRSKNPGAPHDWEHAVDMDMEGFNNIYTTEPVLTSSLPDGFSLDGFVRDADDMLTVSLSNLTKLGANSVTYTFKPKDNKYKNLTYTIKWNVIIDWTATEPILNDDYVSFVEDPDRDPSDSDRFLRGTGVLLKTDITPDPATKYTQPNRIDDAFDSSKFPYVDSLVIVKGKEVGNIWRPYDSIKEHIREYGSYLTSEENIDNMAMEINFPNSQKTDGAEIFLRNPGMGTSYQNQEIRLTTPFAQGEQSRDYVVDIRVTLANGQSKVVKAYIVRFLCPFYIDIEDDIELFTHTQDWCSDRVLFTIKETGTGKLLVYWDRDPRSGHMREYVTEYARDTYGRNVFSQGSLNAPRWHSLANDTFGNRLLYNDRSGWFYWNNMGTLLQFDKTTTYKVTQEISGLAYLTGEGNILIHKSADSPAAHSDEGHGDEREPDDNAHPTPEWEVIFE